MPIDTIDVRVQVLSIDGINPLYATNSVETRVVRLGMVGDLVFGSNRGEYPPFFWIRPSVSRALT